MSKKRILIGAPVHNREEMLPDYLASLVAQHAPSSDIEVGYAFVLNNCNDITVHIMKMFQEKFQDKYPIKLIHAKGESFDYRTSARYYALASYRNMLLDEVVEHGWDYFFSVDTDIIAPVGTLMRLLNHKKDIIAACVYNDGIQIRGKPYQPRLTPRNRRTNVMIFADKENLQYANHISVFPQTLFPCDVTGAIYLMSYKAASLCRYDWDGQGEDIAFCRTAIKAGLEIWADGSLLCQHQMELGLKSKQ